MQEHDVLAILKNADIPEITTLQSFASSDPAKFLGIYQTAIDDLARSGNREIFRKLFRARYTVMAVWHADLAVERLSESPLYADLHGALIAGHRDLVMDALSDNVSPYDWNELRKSARGDEELMTQIMLTRSEVGERRAG